MYDQEFRSTIIKNSLYIAILSSLIAGCSDSNSPAAGTPDITVSSTSVSEGNSGTKNIDLTVTLAEAPNGNMTVDYATADGTATTAGNDYTSTTGTLTINAGDLSGTISIPVNGDRLTEADESFSIAFTNPSANVNLPDSTSVTVTIINDDRLNDTAVTTCINGMAIGLSCPQGSYPGQDAESGLDVTNNDTTDGKAGFSFTQIDANGEPLATKSTDYSTTPWSCVQDNNTGLMWEVKTSDGGLQDTNWTYSWYNSTGVNDGGTPGTEDGLNNCLVTDRCDTEKYVADVNAMALCGYTDWRLPRADELIDIFDFSAISGAYIDSDYFVNVLANKYQSSTSSSNAPSLAVTMDFSSNYIVKKLKSSSWGVILVR